jgi:hypothetical protein
MLSSTANTAAGTEPDAAVAAAHIADATQQAMIAAPVGLVRPRNTISALTRMNASEQPE